MIKMFFPLMRQTNVELDCEEIDDYGYDENRFVMMLSFIGLMMFQSLILMMMTVIFLWMEKMIWR